MEMFNFSSAESKKINRALSFIGTKEVELKELLARTLLIKTENYADECEQLDAYFARLGLEDNSARLAFNTSADGTHKILVNKEAIVDLSYVYSVVSQIVHLGNLDQYNREYGNIYRMEAEQAIADYYYEFLLWSRFQAMKIATRAHALISWHELNGEEPPEGGKYQFSQVGFPVEPVGECLYQLVQARDIAAWREGFWELLGEMTTYFGRLAFYQQEPNPAAIDDRFPAEPLDEMVGLEHTLLLYGALQVARDYTSWKEMRGNIRRSVVAMQDFGKQKFEQKVS